jgi:hypothetical protein
MSEDIVDTRSGQAVGAEALFARAAAAETRARRALAVTTDDFFLSDTDRLDERTRSELAALLAGLVHGVEAEIRDGAARLLSARGEAILAAALVEPAPSALARLSAAGLLRDPALMAELIARVRQEALSAALPTQAPDDPEQPSLINRFAQHPDRVLASGAMSVLVAESRRRGTAGGAPRTQSDLPAELHHRLVWWVAAVLRERRLALAEGEGATLDQAICDAAQRSLAVHDEGDRLEANAMRFAAALDAQADELPELLVESLGDRRVVLFVALLAHALGVAFDLARDLVLDSEGDRLWLALRALEVPRGAVARIGYALCEADPRRDLEQFADTLDLLDGLTADAARLAVAPLRLPPDYRSARLALAQSGRGR